MNVQAGNVFTGVAMCVPLAGRPVPVEWAFAFKGIDPPINFNVLHMSTIRMKVDEARNYCAKWSVEQKTKYTFFLGDDVVPPPHVLRRFIYLMDNNPEIDLLSGVYFTKSEPSFPLVFRGNGSGCYWDWRVGELFKVSGCGMDCCCIRTEVFNKMKEPWFLTVKADTYAEDIAKIEVWTEDLYFCDRVEKELGEGRIWVDASIICDHWDVTQMKKYSMPWNCLPATREFAHGNKKILDLGAGNLKIVDPEGIPVRVDLREECDPDYRCDVRQLPFADESWDVVRSVHTLEHFRRDEVGNVLDEWLRVLKVGGSFRLCVPDLAFAARKILGDDVDDDTMNVLYGQQAYDLDFHKTGFTLPRLKELLESKGLRVDKIWTDKPYNILAESTKIKHRTYIGDGEGRAVKRDPGIPEPKKLTKGNGKHNGRRIHTNQPRQHRQEA